MDGWMDKTAYLRAVNLDRLDFLPLPLTSLRRQDPEDATKTVLVIRSLVPGGVADRDGRLLPGDRLMFVNETDLEGSSLDYAVHVLKSTGYGPVHIGVTKPLPVCIQATLGL